MRSILLDTTAYSAYRNGNTLVLDSLAGVDRVYMSVFVLGELVFGFEGGDRSIENRRFALWRLPGRQLKFPA